MALRTGRIVTGVALGMLMGLTGFSGAEAAGVTPPNVNGVQHFFDCFGAMLHDGATHQQYCSPSSNTPSNNSLGSFSGGALTCHYDAGALDRPLFGPYELASLGDWTDVAPPSGPVPQLVAPGYRPCCGSGYLAEAPLLVPVLVASLDPEFGLPAPSSATQTQLMASPCD